MSDYNLIAKETFETMMDKLFISAKESELDISGHSELCLKVLVTLGYNVVVNIISNIKPSDEERDAVTETMINFISSEMKSIIKEVYDKEKSE